MNFEDAVAALREDAAERNFTQAVDLVINVRNVDLDDPNNRFSEDVRLPHAPSDEVKVCVIGETITTEADNADRLIDPDELEELFDDEAAAKELAEEYDFFLAEAPLMPDIGRELGSVFGPRNKMPDPVQPGEDPSEEIAALRNTISLQLKEAPSVKCKVGEEDMDDDALAANAAAVYERVVDALPQREHNVKDVLVKLTMSSPVSVEG